MRSCGRKPSSSLWTLSKRTIESLIEHLRPTSTNMCTLAAWTLCWFHPRWVFRVPERVEFSGYPVQLDVERTATRVSCIDLIKEACSSALRVTRNDSFDGLGGSGRLICARNDMGLHGTQRICIDPDHSPLRCAVIGEHWTLWRT